MKKYRLIREYPGSPKLGTILTHEELQYCNWNEYYQEVVEKDYKILSLARFCSIKPTITDVSDYGDGYIEALLKCDNARIHSVKRNDGEIFTIGDKVFSEYVNYTINKIGIVNDKCMVSALYDTNNPNGSRLHYNLNNLKKAKQPLFTTEDGVDIFDGDYSYGVHNSKFDIVAIKHINTVYVTDNFIEFSTKEKAEEYILMNKPCLSINDIINNTLNIPAPRISKMAKEAITESLKQLVKEKLNNNK